MDNKDIFDLLDNAEDSVLDELDGLCEPLDKAADKRILALAQRKSIRSNIGTNGDYSDKVEGVERVMKRPWKSTFATVAAAVLICGGTVGGFAVLRTRNKPADTVPEAETSVSRTTENRMDITEEAFVTMVSPEDNAIVTGKAQPLTTADTAENGTDTPAVTTADGGTDEPAIITAAVVTTAGKTTTEAAATDKVTTTAKTTTQKPKTTGTVTDITTKTGETEIHRLESGAYLVDIKAGQVYEWFDRLSMFSEKPEVIKLSAFDDRYFTYEDGCICMNNTSAHTKEKLLDEWATLTHGAHFADLNSDGYPELCLSVTGGSGVCVDYAAAYDIHNDKMYKLVDWMKMDYMFGCKDGAICLLRCEYPQNWAEGDTLVPVIDSEHGLICREQNGVQSEPYPDINGDSKTTVADAMAILEYVGQKAAGNTDSDMEVKCDVNNDGKVIPLDSALYLQYLKSTCLVGDINEDGRVNEEDVSYLSYYIENRKEFWSNIPYEKKLQMNRCETYGDINNDGEINAADIDEIYKQPVFGI